MAKNIPAAEFKSAIKDFNALLKKNEEETIKVVGVKKEVVVEDFTKKVLGYIEADKVADLPDSVIDFYNDYIAEAEGGDDGGEAGDAGEKEKPKGKGDSKGKGKGKSGSKPKKDPKPKKEKKPAGPKVGYEIIRAIVENENCLDREKVLDEVAKVFPDRPKEGMKTTVNHVVGVMTNYFNYLKAAGK